MGAMIKSAVEIGGAIPVRAGVGDVLFRHGDPCRGFLALGRGVIKVTLTSQGGREILLYRVHPGEICLQTFSCLVQGGAYAAQGTVEEPVEALLIPPKTFDRLMTGDAAFRAAVLSSIAERFADFEHTVETLAFTGLEQRVAAALLRLAGSDGIAHVTHEALATEIGSAREAVSRQLAAFARKSLVVLARGRVEICRRDALMRLVEPVV